MARNVWGRKALSCAGPASKMLAAGGDSDTEPLFAPLESRTLAAGDVGVSILGGYIRVTGDAAPNSILVETHGTSVRLSGQGGTTINHGSAPITIDPSKLLTINMGPSTDTIVFRGTAARRLVFANGLTVSVSDGNDVVTADYMNVRGTTSIDLGAGASASKRAEFTSCVFDYFRAQNQLTSGRSSLTLTDTTVLYQFNYTGGGGVDSVTITSSSLSGNANISFGGGRDRLTLRRNQLVASVDFDGGADADRMLGNHNSFAGNSAFRNFERITIS